jgi:hypothetical protein
MSNMSKGRYFAATALAVGLSMGIADTAQADEAPAEDPIECAADEAASEEDEALEPSISAAPVETAGIDSNTVTKYGLDAAKVVSPFILGAGAIHLASRMDPRNRQTNVLRKMALRDSSHHNVIRAVMAGTLAPAVGVALLSTAIGMENDVRTGPNRAQEAMAELFEIEDPESAYVMLQAGTRHTSNHSLLPANAVEDFEEALERDAGASAAPFSMSLGFSQDVDDVFLLGVPGEENQDQEGYTATVDGGESMDVGDTVEVRGQEVEIVGHNEDPLSYLNRLTFIMPEEQLTDLLQLPEGAHSGIVISAEDRQMVEEAMRVAGISDIAELQSFAEFVKSNEDFWRGNGTPILTMLTFLVAGSYAVSMAHSKGQDFEKNKKTLSVIRATGGRIGDLRSLELLRSEIKTLIALPLGYLASIAALDGVNDTNVGFHADVFGPDKAIQAAGLIMAAQYFATYRQLQRIRRLSATEFLRQD